MKIVDRFSVLFAGLAIILVSIWLQYPHADAAAGPPRVRVFFVDPDDYMRVYRASLIAEGRSERIRQLPEINYPAGADLHWTAPMDYLIVTAYRAFGGMTGRADAFSRLAAYLPAVLGVAYLVCLLVFMERGFGAGPAVLAGLLAALSPAFYRVFQVGHPDHHCLLELLLLCAVGAWIPNRKPDGRPGDPCRFAAIVSGFAIGLAVWVAAQAVFFWAVLAFGLAYAGSSGTAAERRAYLRARFLWNCAAAAVVVAGFLVENWPDLTTVVVDRISLVHVALAAIAFLVPGRVPSRTESSLEREREQRTAPPQLGRTSAPGKPPPVSSARLFGIRLVVFISALAAFGGWLALDRSHVFQYVSSPAFYRWSERIAELQPLYVRAGTDWSLRPLHDLVGFLPYALLPAVVFFALSGQVPRPVKAALVVLAPTLMVLMILQRRWLDHLNLAVTPVIVLGIWELVRRLFARARAPHRLWRVGLCPVLLGILVFRPIGFVLSFTPNQVLEIRTDFAAQCISGWAAARPIPGPDRRAILSEEGDGPMLLYRTGMPVVAVPYHRALSGILEMAAFFAERDPAKARAQLDRLGVRYIVVPARSHEQLMQFEYLAFGELRSFDPPTQTIYASGRLREQLHYRSEFVQTMAYRLTMMPGSESIPGVHCIQTIFEEGAKRPDGQPLATGLLYVVDELPGGASQPVGPE